MKQFCRDGKIRWSSHAASRMMERLIFRQEVLDTILSGEVIEDYPDDFPLPSCLVLGHKEGKPLHVVVALSDSEIVIISVYRPDERRFESDLKTRRKWDMCAYCKGTDLRDSLTTYVAVIHTSTIIIRNVPCQECVQCGEKYYTDKVMQDIEAIIKKAIEIQSEFYVTEYSSVA